MTWMDAAPLGLILLLGFAVGAGVGLAYFRALRLTTDMIVGGGSALLVLALTLGRLALLGAIFFVMALAGGPALLAALAGILVAKALMLRHDTRIRT